MRGIRSAIFFILGVGCCGIAAAQSRADMERCRAILEPDRRLACYDAIDLAIAPPRSKYQVVELSDLKQFALSYRGDLVEVSGWVVPDGETLTLGADAADKSPLPVEFDALSRSDQRAFFEACGNGCEATVQGRVKPVNFTTGISADALFVK